MVMQTLNSGNASKALQLFLGLLLVGALMGLVLTDVGGFFRSGTSRTDVARVGNETISAADFARTYQRRLEQSGLTQEMARGMGLENMVLQQEVERQVLLQAARSNGVRISDNFIATQLRQQLDTIQMIGTPEEKLQQVLIQQQISERQLVELLRGDFSINVLASAVTTGDMQIADDLVLAAYRTGHEKRDADLIVIPQSSITKAKPDDAAIEAYYNENKENYRVNATRDVAVLVLPQELFVKDITVDPADAEAYYKDHIDQFMTGERVRIAQIIADNEKTARDILKDKPKELASFKGQDGIQYLEADWYGKDGLPNELASAIYPAKEKGLHGPVKTSLGWHVLLVDRYEEPAPKSFAEVKNMVIRMLKDEQLDAHLTAVTDELDALVSEGVSLDEIAAKYKLKTVALKEIDAVSIQRKLDASGIDKAIHPRIQEAAFTLEQDETSPLMDTATGDYALLQVIRITPDTVPPLAEIRSRVAQDAERAAVKKALNDEAESLIALFNPADSSAFDKAVKDKGLQRKTLAATTASAVEKSNSREMASLLFTMTPDNPLSYIQGESSITLVYLKKIIPSTDTPSDEQSTAIKDALRTTLLQEIQQQFIHGWESRLGTSVNHSLLRSMFNPQTAE